VYPWLTLMCPILEPRFPIFPTYWLLWLLLLLPPKPLAATGTESEYPPALGGARVGIGREDGKAGAPPLVAVVVEPIPIPANKPPLVLVGEDELVEVEVEVEDPLLIWNLGADPPPDGILERKSSMSKPPPDEAEGTVELEEDSATAAGGA
jgi:hypothetical protein